MKKICSIEGLRGVLALWVLVGHTLATAGLGGRWRGPLAAIAEGANAVTVFIIVSGFVIFFLLDTARESYGAFLYRRALRLYPVYLICLLAAVPLQSMELAALRQSPWQHPLNPGLIDIATDSLRYLPQQLAAHLTMIHGLLPNSLLPHSTYALLGPAWSLSLEWQFYIVAPALFWIISKGPLPGAALAILALAACVFVGGREGTLIHHVPMFAVGIASYLLWKREGRPKSTLPGLVILLAAVLTRSLPLVVWAAVFLSFYQPTLFGAGLIRGALESRPMLTLGRLSYSIYLSHVLVLIVAMRLLERLNAASFGHVGFFAALLAATLAGTFMCAEALNRFVEKPGMTLGHRPTRAAETRLATEHQG